jgi:hypothetical protein
VLSGYHEGTPYISGSITGNLINGATIEINLINGAE